MYVNGAYGPTSLTLIIHFGVEQLAARQAHNLEAVGSSPTPETIVNAA